MCLHQRFDDGAPTRSVTRRRVLGTGATAAVALAGCLGGGDREAGPAPDPVSLASGKQCDVCGMVIGDHAGPNGQLFYAEHAPETHENPAWFDSLAACLFPYQFRHERQDWTAVAQYATDYSTVDYEIAQRGGKHYISSHVAPESFGDATTLYYVAGSRVRGAMGRDLIPFSHRGDANEFASTHDGRVVGYGDVTPELLEGSANQRFPAGGTHRTPWRD